MLDWQEIKTLLATYANKTVLLSGGSRAVLLSLLSSARVGNFLNEQENDDADAWLARATYELMTEVAPMTISACRLMDRQNQGVNGGASIANGWQTRTLNEIQQNQSWLLELASSAFKLEPGQYFFHADVPHLFSGSANRWIRLRIASPIVVYLESPNFYSVQQSVGDILSFAGIIQVPSATTQFRLQYYTNDARATNGLGAAHNIAGHFEYYSALSIIKLS